MKVLKDDAYGALQSDAQKWQTLVSAVKESNSEFDSDNATPESIAQALTVNNDENLKSQLATANASVSTLKKESLEKDGKIKTLESQISTLKGLPANQTASAGAGEEAEPSVEKGNELVSFASENKDDYMAIASKAIENGFFPKSNFKK